MNRVYVCYKIQTLHFVQKLLNSELFENLARKSDKFCETIFLLKLFFSLSILLYVSHRYRGHFSFTVKIGLDFTCRTGYLTRTYQEQFVSRSF